MKIVLDTNVIVSALLIPSSIPAKILTKILTKTLSNALTIVYDHRIFNEYIDVLFRDKLKMNKDAVKFILEYFKKEGFFLLADPLKISFKDESDKKFYEVYKSSDAQYLITGKIKHFPKEKGIVTPREFIENTKTQ